MKKIAIFNKKGGVGKTTIAVNLSACLAAYHGKKVLIVDCDSQANASSYLLVNYQGNEKPNIEDFITGKADSEALPYNICFPKKKSHKHDCNLDFIAGSQTIDMIRVEDPDVISEMIKDYDYDYVVYDCPPYVSDLSMCALNASDYVLVPALPDTDSLNGYQILVDIVNKIRGTGKSIQILGIVINCISSSEALDQYIYKQLTSGSNSELIMKSTLRKGAAAKRSRFFGEPICMREPSSKLTQDYKNFTKEMLKKMGDK